MRKPSRRGAIVQHLVYGVVLFVITLSTLEQFTELNDDILGLGPGTFHLIVVLFAMVVACFEGLTMKGLDGLKTFFSSPEPVVEPPPEGPYKFRRAAPGEISKIHHLAQRMYGRRFAFSEERLSQWWQANHDCFFVMLFNNDVVGYIDGFPISREDYEYLLKHDADETRINPQTHTSVGAESSFYIASFVVEPKHRGEVRRFVNEALKFYARSYPNKVWKRVCAIGFTDKGLSWLRRKDMMRHEDSDMWYVDRELLAAVKSENRAFWGRLLPEAVTAGVRKPDPTAKTG